MYCNLLSYECEISFFAEIPEPPRDCIFRNTCERCIEIICEAGEDGGLQQTFVLEVNEAAAPPEKHLGSTTLSDQGAATAPLLRFQQNEPVFRLDSLRPGREYQMLVYAVNAKGRSDPPVQMNNIVLTLPADSIDSTGENGPISFLQTFQSYLFPDTSGFAEGNILSQSIGEHSLTLILGALIAAVTLVVLISTVVAIVAFCRRTTVSEVNRRRQQHDRSNSSRDSKSQDDNVELREASEHGFGEGFQRRSMEWRESRIRASLYIHPEPDGSRTPQHITIGNVFK